MGLGRVPHRHQPADLGARAAAMRLSQANGTSAPSPAGCGNAGDVQKNFPAALAAIAADVGPGKRIEVWFQDEAQDEAQVGQKNGITRRWARRGSRPSAPKDQRTASAYLFGATCPAEGKASCPAATPRP